MENHDGGFRSELAKSRRKINRDYYRRRLPLLLKSGRDAGASRLDYLACPFGKEPVIAAKRHLYCREHRVIYPVIDGIACLDRRHAIPASRFLEESDSRTA